MKIPGFPQKPGSSLSQRQLPKGGMKIGGALLLLPPKGNTQYNPLPSSAGQLGDAREPLTSTCGRGDRAAILRDKSHTHARRTHHLWANAVPPRAQKPNSMCPVCTRHHDGKNWTRFRGDRERRGQKRPSLPGTTEETQPRFGVQCKEHQTWVLPIAPPYFPELRRGCRVKW